MDIEEVWKDVPNFEGYYQVSNYGRVKSLNYNKTKKERIMSLGKNKDGYLFIQLSKKGKTKTFRINRLVYETFIGSLPKWDAKAKADERMEVNHIDENRANNCVWNLELVTTRQNINHGNHNKKISESHINGADSKKVFQYDMHGNLIKTWPSVSECGRAGYNFGNVASCCRGERKSHKGFIWSYKTNLY